MQAPRFTARDMRCIHHLVGLALVQPYLCQRLLSGDESLVEEFTISQSAWDLIQTIEAVTLQDFCHQIRKINCS